MITCTEAHHLDHAHQHGPNCGHTAIRHDGHVDYTPFTSVPENPLD